ncbi:MAG TPA: GNAT family N-acetyltransferase [Rugosimonospora sp.]|nr:GNAT family N-acetyltransferase [Rugosimonospora sp.]
MSINDLEPQLDINRAYWAGYDGSSPHTDLPIYRTGLPHRLLNGVLRVRGWPIEKAVAEARKRLDGTRWAWWVGADSDPDTANALLDAGAQELDPLPVMAVDLQTFAEFPPPAELTIRRVTTRAELRGYVETAAEPLGVPADVVEELLECEIAYAPSEGRLVRLAGMVGDRTVGTAAVLLGGKAAAIYWVATDAAYRQRGTATALTTETLRLARKAGASIATLQASSMGQPVYRRIGFATVAQYRRFAS